MSEQLKDLQALFRDAMEWGRAYLNRAMEVTIEEVSLGLAEKAAALSPHHAAPGAPQQEASGAHWCALEHGGVFCKECDRRVIESSRSAATAPADRCPHCDCTGDVHSKDGEWRGVCTCGAATAPAGGVTPSTVFFPCVDDPNNTRLQLWDLIDSYAEARHKHGAPEYSALAHAARVKVLAALTTAARAAEPDMVQQCMAIINAAWAAIPQHLRVDDGTDPTGNPLPAAVRALAARAAELQGWKLVPIEPTAEMQRAGNDCAHGLANTPKGMWYWGRVFKAMCAASPTPPTGTSKEGGEPA